MRGKRQAAVAAAVVAGVVVVAILLGAGGDPPGNAAPVIVCIDSTVSTDGVRESYLPDLESVTRRAAVRQARFYAAACGANATGEVDWPVRREFTSSYSGDLAREQANHQAEEVIKGSKDSEGLEDLVARSPEQNGTPLGEMLAVAARQCGQAGGDCVVYLFTDGEWADGALKVSDGVEDTERSNYLDAYIPRLKDLAGSQVNFIGVGYGTNMGELHLDEAHKIAAELVRGAEAEVGAWSTRL